MCGFSWVWRQIQLRQAGIPFNSFLLAILFEAVFIILFNHQNPVKNEPDHGTHCHSA